MNDSVTLRQALALAARDLEAQGPPPVLAGRVCAAVRRVQARDADAAPARATPARADAGTWRRAGTGRTAWPRGLAAGCAAAFVGLVLLVLWPAPSSPDRPLSLASGFVPLVPPERWPAEAAAAWLIDAELPAERLMVLGLPPDASRAGRNVRAEMLVHPSGELLAVRFVH